MNPKCFSKSEYLIFGLVLISVSQSAWAYLDPGTGTIILQGIVAGIVGGYMAIKMGWFRIKSMLPGQKKNPETPTKDSTNSNNL